MQKEFEVTLKIAAIEPQQTVLERFVHTLWASLYHRPVIDVSALSRHTVGRILHNALESRSRFLYFLPPCEPNISLRELLPTDTATKEVTLRKSIYDRGWTVLRRNRQGKAVKALWLLKVLPTEARLALYVSRSRYTLVERGEDNLLYK